MLDIILRIPSSVVIVPISSSQPYQPGNTSTQGPKIQNNHISIPEYPKPPNKDILRKQPLRLTDN